MCINKLLEELKNGASVSDWVKWSQVYKMLKECRDMLNGGR